LKEICQDVYDNFGDYNLLLNNCQMYRARVIRRLESKYAPPKKSIDKEKMPLNLVKLLRKHPVQDLYAKKMSQIKGTKPRWFQFEKVKISGRAYHDGVDTLSNRTLSGWERLFGDHLE